MALVAATFLMADATGVWTGDQPSRSPRCSDEDSMARFFSFRLSSLGGVRGAMGQPDVRSGCAIDVLRRADVGGVGNAESSGPKGARMAVQCRVRRSEFRAGVNL
jgi:hypothetical protein